MKVALILTGGVRIFEDTYHSIKHHILDKFSDVDVFIYGVENKFGSDYNTERLSELYKPKSIVINKKNFYDDNQIIKSNRINPRFKSVISALFNVKMANENKRKYQLEKKINYDLVLRTRMDHFWIRGLDEKEIELASENIITPLDFAFKCVKSFALADMYCITNDDMFDFYSLAYDHHTDFLDIFDFHPESFLGYYLRNQSIYECERHINTEYPLVGNWTTPKFNAFNTFDLNGNQVYPIISQPCGDPNHREINLEFFSPKVWKFPEDFPEYQGDPVELRRRFD